MKFFKVLAAIVSFSMVSVSSSFVGQTFQLDVSYGPSLTVSTGTFLSNALRVLETGNPNISQMGPIYFTNTSSVTAQQMIYTPSVSSWTGTFSPPAPYNVEQGDELYGFMMITQGTGGPMLTLAGNALGFVPSDFDPNQPYVSFGSGATFDQSTAWGFDWADGPGSALAPVIGGTSANVIIIKDVFGIFSSQSGYQSTVNATDADITGVTLTGFGSNGLSNSEFISLDVPSVPEPSVSVLFVLGLCALFFYRTKTTE